MADPYANTPVAAAAGLHQDFRYVALFYLDGAHYGTAGGMDLDDVRRAIRSRVLMDLGDGSKKGRVQCRVIDRTGTTETWCDPSLPPNEQWKIPEDWRKFNGYMNMGVKIEGGWGDLL